ncbi:MAG: YgjP-like metallopeptidase domain-containing protein [Burkholderiaceae bacterium]
MSDRLGQLSLWEELLGPIAAPSVPAPSALPVSPPAAPRVVPRVAPRPDPVAGDPSLRTAALAGEPIRYRLRRAKRKTIGFSIDDQGLTISAPRWVSLREIEGAVAEKERWIRKKLEHWRDWRERRKLPELRFAEGGQLPYLGEVITLRLSAVAQTAVLGSIGARELHLALPPAADELQVRDALQAWLQGEARRVFGERLAQIAPRVEVSFKSWTLSAARRQWGSCTQDKRIRLNWRLIHFPLPLIDYVVAHELAHLREMNHSPRFWQVVGEILPGYETARAELRGHDLGALPL